MKISVREVDLDDVLVNWHVINSHYLSDRHKKSDCVVLLRMLSILFGNIHIDETESWIEIKDQLMQQGCIYECENKAGVLEELHRRLG